MDPDATLADVEWELRKGKHLRNREELLGQLTDLSEWVVKGGYEPDWRKAPLAASLYRILYTNTFDGKY